MIKNDLPIETILDLYNNKNESTHSIAKKYNTYPARIARLLRKSGYPLKSRKDAQIKAIETGRASHPMAGKKHNEETKLRISESKSKSWENISPEKKQELVDSARERWNTMDESERKRIQEMAAEAIRKAAKNGSKMEIFVKDHLRKNGYDVVFHKKGAIPNENLELDIYLPALRIAVEIDGPSHFLPIWGEDKLLKHIKADSEKSALLLNAGISIIRVKHMAKFVSDKGKRDLGNAIINAIENIRNNSNLTKQDMYVELEV